ncbi:nucleotidyltransferase family protein [Ruegeria sp. Alg231-54]|uniref:nucleotidyltransferase family protein n=1 Tax=Ruegeria sp. Alg231-54 TaxID=1922221 RepID=UPI000D562CD5|nr:nucleotidyltransferase family protein [Ruegeria sp. Alg231-54]
MDAAEFVRIIGTNQTNQKILEALPLTGLKDAWLVSGCLFQTVWNYKTGRRPDFGIKDYDLFYFDGNDLTWDGEDAAIHQAMKVLGTIDADIEIRDQARVHLWYEQKFGVAYEPARQATDGIDRFLAAACMLGIRRSKEGAIEVYAPKGFADLEQFAIRPNSHIDFDAAT